MKLSISNIAWTEENDAKVYEIMKKYYFNGLEIAPTRIFTEKPYEKMKEAIAWRKNLEIETGFSVSSMQSIWYGRQEKIFGSEKERKTLLNYTKQAIDFAANIGCHNLVFGCPRNRNLLDGVDVKVAVPFFYELGEYALSRDTVIGMEANPPIYNTNYINDTSSALHLIEEVNSKGFLLNLDVGTMIENQEDISELNGKEAFINHVHISEPGLKSIQKRTLHEELAAFLLENNYLGYVSIEMSSQGDLSIIERTMSYVKEIFG